MTVYDCKTGKPRTSDRVQVMIYMYALSTYPRFAQSRIRGMVIYQDRRLEIPYLPEQFDSDVAYFKRLLAEETLLGKSPGHDCQFCKITSTDCPDRQDVADDPRGLDDVEEQHD